MAGNSCFSTLTATFLLLLLVILSATSTTNAGRHNPIKAAANEAINPFCTTATTHLDDKVICTRLVNGAKTWPDAMTHAVKGVIEIANKVAKPMVNGLEEKLPRGLLPVTIESLVSICKETLDTYVFNLEQCIGLVDKHDQTSDLETYLGGSTFSGCKNTFDDVQIPSSEVDQFYETTTKFADILLSIYQKRPKN